MDRRKFIAIHTYHDDECKKALWKGVSTWPENDHQWQEDYTFEKCRCTQHWVGDDDFFFCEWEAEEGQDITRSAGFINVNRINQNQSEIS